MALTPFVTPDHKLLFFFEEMDFTTDFDFQANGVSETS
jgi:hypothetical protein